MRLPTIYTFFLFAYYFLFTNNNSRLLKIKNEFFCLFKSFQEQFEAWVGRFGLIDD